MRKILLFAALYLVLLMTFTVLVIVVHLIPRSAIQDNAVRSVELFEREGAYPMKTSIDGTAAVDNFTDCYMLNVALCADATHPVDAAMRNYRYRAVPSMPLSTRHLVDNTLIDQPFEYGKYWHGYQVTFRPLLALMDYSGIRVVNSVAICALLLVTLIVIWRRLSPAIALSLAVSMAMVHSGVLPWSLQFSNCYYIALVSVILLLAVDRLTATFTRQMMCFFAIGAFTSFLDFLTTPVITLGVPLIVVMLKDKSTSQKKLFIGLSVAWAAGYGLMWVSKWGMDILLAGYNPMNEVGNSVEIHSAGTDEPLWSLWRKICVMLLSRWVPLTVAGLVRWAVVALPVAMAFMTARSRAGWRENVWLLAVAAMPLVWYFVVAHHSYTHFFITMRSLLVWWFALLCFLCQAIDFAKIPLEIVQRLGMKTR